VGGHLTALRRESVGPYTADQSKTLDQLETEFTFTSISDAARARFAARDLTEEEADHLRHGRKIQATGSPANSDPVAAFAPDGELIALIEDRGPAAKPILVFATS
jgi:tRNA pseudouridine55 synthase